MELTREYQQYVLDVLADIRGRRTGETLKYTLVPEETEESDGTEDSPTGQAHSGCA